MESFQNVDKPMQATDTLVNHAKMKESSDTMTENLPEIHIGEIWNMLMI